MPLYARKEERERRLALDINGQGGDRWLKVFKGVA
jgi:hypothetical protein